MVLVHGFMGSKVDFHDQIEPLTAHCRVLAYDQRGHGESSNLVQPECYSFETLQQDLLGFLDAMAIDTCHLVGHSMGGMVAMRFALNYPERVNSLVLMSTSPDPVEVVPEPVRRLFCRKVRKHGCSVMLKTICAHPLASVKHSEEGEKEKQLDRLAAKYEQMDPEAFVALSAELTRHTSVLEQLKDITCPTTILFGEKDDVFRPPAFAMADVIPQATLVEVPDAAHSPHYENMRQWQENIVAHLERAALSGVRSYESPHSSAQQFLHTAPHSLEN